MAYKQEINTNFKTSNSTNAMGVNAKTPVPPIKSSNELPKNQYGLIGNAINYKKNIDKTRGLVVGGAMSLLGGEKGKELAQKTYSGQQWTPLNAPIGKQVPKEAPKVNVQGAVNSAMSKTGATNTANSSNSSMIPKSSGETTGVKSGYSASNQASESPTPAVPKTLQELQRELAMRQVQLKDQQKVEREQKMADKKNKKNTQNSNNTGTNTSRSNILTTAFENSQSGKTPAIVQKSMDNITSIQNEIEKAKNDYAAKVAGFNTKGMDLQARAGAEGKIQNLYVAQMSALNEKLNQANTQLAQEVSMYGTQQGTLQGLMGTTAPQMQFGQLTDPQTGMPVSGGMYGSNPQLQTAVQQAVQLVQNGANPNDPQVQALLSTFGLPGQSLFTQYMQGGSQGYNPTALSASVDAQTNQATQYGTQAFNLSSALQQVQSIKPLITSFLKTSGINPTDSATYNAPINSYIGSLGNQANVSYQTMLSELQNFSSAILNSGTALTPSSVSEATALQNPGTLSVPQIEAYLENLHRVGETKLSNLQQQAGSLGYSGNTGNQAQSYSSTTPMPQSTAFGGNVQDPLAQGAIGVVPQAFNAVASTALGAWLLGKFR